MARDEELFKKADQALRKHNLDYAIELILQGLTINPDAVEQRKKLHNVETKAIQDKGGKPEGGFAVKFKVLPHETRAKKLHLQKKYDEEAIELEKSLRFQPRCLGTLNSLARALEMGEIFTAAIGVYEEITAIEPGQVEALRSLGKLTASHLDDLEKAIEYWEKLKQFKPDDKEAGKAVRDLSAATMVRRADERKKGGEGSFRDLLKDEQESEELQQKAQIIRNDDDRRRAIKFKMVELRQEPKNSRLHREVGVLFQDLKMWDKAETCFRNALKVDSNDLYAQERLGMLEESRLDTELEELVKRSNGSDDPEIIRQLEDKRAEILAFRMQEYKRRMDAHPTDYLLKQQYGEVLMENKEFDEAIKHFQLALKDPKQKVKARKAIGDCFVEKELYDMAIQQYSDAIAEVEKSSTLYQEIKYDMAVACENNGDDQEALNHYQEIMASDISYRDISDRVTRLRKKGAALS